MAEVSGLSPGRFLLYRVGPDVGLGHVLVSICVYAHYAHKTGREFHVLLRDWQMAIDPTADVDPFFTRHFDLDDLSERSINLSAEKALTSLRAIERSACSSIIVANPNVSLQGLFRAFSPLWRTVNSLLGNKSKRVIRRWTSFCKVQRARVRSRLPDNHARESRALWPQPTRGLFRNSGLLAIDEFRNYLINDLDHPADYVFVNSVAPFSSSEPLGLLDRYPPFAPFSSNLKFKSLDELDIEAFIGIHVRHGNGEHLKGRIEGDTAEFDKLMAAIEVSVKENYGDRKLIALSDSPDVVAHFRRKLDALDLSSESLTREVHYKAFQLMAEDDKTAMVSAVLQDLVILSRCGDVVCSESLFTVASFIFSKTRRFTVI